jgi:hypothetical protein
MKMKKIKPNSSKVNFKKSLDEKIETIKILGFNLTKNKIKYTKRILKFNVLLIIIL